jgi:hypothetical protein
MVEDLMPVAKTTPKSKLTIVPWFGFDWMSIGMWFLSQYSLTMASPMPSPVLVWLVW